MLIPKELTKQCSLLVQPNLIKKIDDGRKYKNNNKNGYTAYKSQCAKISGNMALTLPMRWITIWLT